MQEHQGPQARGISRKTLRMQSRHRSRCAHRAADRAHSLRQHPDGQVRIGTERHGGAERLNTPRDVSDATMYICIYT
jgi:hypothetical protein